MQEEWGSFDEELAQEMKDISFAREVFLFELKEFDESIEKVLRSTIDKMDREWFAKQVGEEVDVINSFVSGEHQPTNNEMNCYLAVLGLKQTGTHSVEVLRVDANESTVDAVFKGHTPSQHYIPLLNGMIWGEHGIPSPLLPVSAQGNCFQNENNEGEASLLLVVNGIARNGRIF